MYIKICYNFKQAQCCTPFVQGRKYEYKKSGFRFFCSLSSCRYSASFRKLPSLAGSKVRIYTESGASFQGTLLSVSDERIEIADQNGQVVIILRSVIERVWEIDPTLDKRSYYQDAAANRLIVMPTGFPMETGEFHIADQEIAAVTMSYGVNRNFSLWGGISIPGAIVSARFIMGLGKQAALSLGSFAGLSWIEFAGLFIPYLVFSAGTPENNFTAGAGGLFTFTDNGFTINAAILCLGGKFVLSDSTALITENWIVWGKMPSYTDSPDSFFSEGQGDWDYMPVAACPGIAFRIADEILGWDIGAILPFRISILDGRYTVEGLGGVNIFIPIPVLSLTYRID